MNSYFTFYIADKEPAYTPLTHYHPDYEVYYLTDGRCRYFIHDKTYSLSAGDIVVIPPGLIHKVIYDTPSHSRLLFNCTEDYVPKSVLPVLDRITYFSQTPDTARQTASIYGKLREAVIHPDAFAQDTIRCCAMQLFLLMAKASFQSNPLATTSPFIEQAVAYIRVNYMDRFTLTDVAKYCAVSPEHLSRVFKKETGFGFNEYLNLYRLRKAEALLKSGQAQSISQVALLCGFNDSNYFSGAYKKMFGISPSQVKKISQKESDYV